MTQKPLSLEILNTKTEALFNALQVICTGLSTEQRKDIAEILETIADQQFNTPAHTNISPEAKAEGIRVSKHLADVVRKSLATTGQSGN